MKNIQEIFDSLSRIKKEQKECKNIYKDALENTSHYKETVEQLKALREKKIQMETRVKQELGQQYQKIEDLELDLKGQKEMLNDVAIASLMKGDTVEVKDEYGNAYEPVWSVTFRKNLSKIKPIDL